MNRNNNPCCICGLALATQDSDSPQWSKDIRALCMVESEVVLSDIGFIDGDTRPYNVHLFHHGSRRFSYRCSDNSDEFCYPFHAICWSIVLEIDHHGFSNGLHVLFDIFQSAQYVREGSRCLNWGQDLYLQEIYHNMPEGTDLLESGDPLLFPSSSKIPISLLTRPSVILLDTLNDRDSHASGLKAHGLLSLPKEIIESIFCILDSADVLCLLVSSLTLYKTYGRQLPNSFWKSRFWIFNETAFASSIRPSSCSHKDWYFSIISALRNSSYRSNLLNRKRIWKIGLDLISIIRSLSNPDRRLHGHDVVTLASLRSYTANCTATKYSFATCRELKQVRVSFKNRHCGLRLCDITPSHILISGRRLISGLTFRFTDGTIYDVGYTTKGNNDYTSDIPASIAPQYLWLACSRFGLEGIKVDGVGQPIIDHLTPSPGNLTAVTRWLFANSTGISIGLDAMRIVKISLETSQNVRHQQLEDALWTPAYPIISPVMHEEDIAALYQLQRQAFAPASYICVEPKNGNLTAIVTCSQLGPEAGITGIRLCYSTGVEERWGSVDSTASLAFFLREGESLTEVDIYKTGSVVRHLSFTTSFGRTSDLMPQMSTQYGDHVKYTASESIIGFCGSMVNSASGASSLKQLNCFGVIGAKCKVSLSPASPTRPQLTAAHIQSLDNVPLGGIRDHGEHRSRLKLTNNFRSIQASVLQQVSDYRQVGQVTGLLFRHENDWGYPKLIGQWTGPGEIYHLEEGEQILALEILEVKPRYRILSRHGLSQVSGITVVTNRHRVSWNRSTASDFVVETTGEPRGPIVEEIIWDFNAIFDRVRCK